MESRIAELEAMLSQSRRSLRLAQEEILEMRKGNLGGGTTSVAGGNEGSTTTLNNVYANCDLHRAEIDTLVK